MATDVQWELEVKALIVLIIIALLVIDAEYVCHNKCLAYHAKGAIMKNHCNIGPTCATQPDETIEDYGEYHGYNFPRIGETDTDEVKPNVR